LRKLISFGADLFLVALDASVVLGHERLNQGQHLAVCLLLARLELLQRFLSGALGIGQDFVSLHRIIDDIRQLHSGRL
jgi:hypothetical protein